MAAELAMQLVAHRGAAGKQQPVDPGMAGQGLAGLPPSLDQVDHPRGQSGGQPGLQGGLGGEGSQLRRLEHHRIACQQSRHQMTVGQMAGKVVGPEHRHHPVGPVAQHRLGPRGGETALPGAFSIGLDRELDLAPHGVDLPGGLPAGLTSLPGDGRGQLLLADLQLPPKGLQQGDPLGQRPVRPVLEGQPGGGHRGVDLRLGGTAPGPEPLPGGRIPGVEEFPVAGQPAVVEQVGGFGHGEYSPGQNGT